MFLDMKDFTSKRRNVSKRNRMAATLPKVEAYLRKKWFDADTAGFRRAACAALHVAAGARVAVDDWAAARGGAAYEAGAGELALVVSNAGSVLIVR